MLLAINKPDFQCVLDTDFIVFIGTTNGNESECTVYFQNTFNISLPITTIELAELIHEAMKRKQ